uniref:Uncharacterized protein n=1 Tax=Anguilla anguilla TaxID=7936 RepID=A0A0E9RTM7_ANGAN
MSILSEIVMRLSLWTKMQANRKSQSGLI